MSKVDGPRPHRTPLDLLPDISMHLIKEPVTLHGEQIQDYLQQLIGRSTGQLAAASWQYLGGETLAAAEIRRKLPKISDNELEQTIGQFRRSAGKTFVSDVTDFGSRKILALFPYVRESEQQPVTGMTFDVPQFAYFSDITGVLKHFDPRFREKNSIHFQLTPAGVVYYTFRVSEYKYGRPRETDLRGFAYHPIFNTILKVRNGFYGMRGYADAVRIWDSSSIDRLYWHHHVSLIKSNLINTSLENAQGLQALGIPLPFEVRHP